MHPQAVVADADYPPLVSPTSGSLTSILILLRIIEEVFFFF